MNNKGYKVAPQKTADVGIDDNQGYDIMPDDVLARYVIIPDESVPLIARK